ncbi:MAG: hypothetical protein LQ347_001601 [Umbilicaria vellea]|nr:MAG: hypothetical protein LQ347_001601 [Umbilicaria vellea]
MAKQAGDMVHRERRNLWTLKQLLTKFRGDGIWIPCEALQSESDIALFGPAPLYSSTPVCGSHQALVNRDEQILAHADDIIAVPGEPSDKGGPSQEHQPMGTIDGNQSTPLPVTDATTAGETVNAAIDRKDYQMVAETARAINSKAVAKDDESLTHSREGVNIQIANQALNQEGTQQQTIGINSHVNNKAALTSTGGVGNQFSSDPVLFEHPAGSTSPQLNAAESATPAVEIGSLLISDNPGVANNEDGQRELLNEEDGEVQSAPHRMTTRARAQAVSDNVTPSHTRSPSLAPSISPYIHPLYLVPSSARPDRDFGLPPTEAEETRRVLMSYAQKQEEVCRGAERLYEGLLKADRVRKTVLKWCKAEGHVGDASDGEDWYDKEEWELEEDLKKGGEDDDEDAVNQGKKSRGRRA